MPQSVGSRGVSLRLLRAAAAAAEAGPLDLMRVAVRPELVAEFNPFLSPEAAQELQRRVLTWLQLCVLEDRLGRVEALAAAREAGDDCLPQLVQVSGMATAGGVGNAQGRRHWLDNHAREWPLCPRAPNAIICGRRS